eukprot:CAMPEP_0175066912 /NCGR_PEP_ID=MMETSP0052_2-20121109/16786_1 /TAXON_ID=51329 ORGANISM="Polytomella parva, Strain SAG 63-3" /NCGR_SAMPLE_ID=MMETSP0052_2 /ASSEMBLY_ACC=CAM_ASM_000194 /LENGTH=431 /DNA_ID=CAMNT_0016333695 /DNA_START=78 /DNA_END=1373 /DNA_ORIENTATION=+
MGEGNSDSQGNGFSQQREDDDIAETDPEGRYFRYKEMVGKGRFKEVYKGFNSQIGIDVAWCKVNASTNHLDKASMDQVALDMQKGLELDHPNIIKCFKCWKDESNSCINLITELFTSGNLRQYRNLHKHLDLKAVKRMARQILKGLAYLHAMEPPVTHGDLRCDKIYVNGHSGEIKIGDLGLQTLLPFRWENHEQHKGGFNSSVDIFAFGLCMLELITLKQLDPQHCDNCQELILEVQDEEARKFIAKCLGPEKDRPTAEGMLNDPLLQLVLKKPIPEKTIDDIGNESGELGSSSLSFGATERRRTEDTLTRDETPIEGRKDGGSDGEGDISVGKLKGEDYEFTFKAEPAEGNQLNFSLQLQGVSRPGDKSVQVQFIQFVYDPDQDTADSLANELSQQFSLSSTDTEICAAALKEYLASKGKFKGANSFVL